MYNMILYILPVLAIIFIGSLGFYLLRQKVAEYNYKFSSMFTLLNAITDEITKIKFQINGGVPSAPRHDISNQEEDQDEIIYDVKRVEYEDEYDEEDDVDEDDEEEDEDEDEDEDEEDDEEDDEEEEDEHEVVDDNLTNQQDNSVIASIDIDNLEITELEDINDTGKSLNVIDEIIENANEIKTSKEVSVDLNPKDYSEMTVKQLRSLAKGRGLKGDVSKFKRDELIEQFQRLDATI